VRRLAMMLAAALVMAVLWPAPVDAQTETSVTGAGEGIFPPNASYLGVPLNGLTLGMGLSVTGGWAIGQFQTTLIGVSDLGVEREIQVEGIATSSAPSEPGTAIFAGTCTVDAGDGTPPLPGVPFTVAVATNADGTGILTLTLGTTDLPAATINGGYITVQ
jgi:hypothetical protein